MKIILLTLFTTLLATYSFAQKIDWIPFKWKGDTISGKYHEKAYMVIPVTIDNLPHKFEMQFDLGAVTTTIYGNPIKPYLEKYISLKSKIDSTSSVWIENQKNYLFKNVGIKLGQIEFKNTNIAHFKNFGDSISTKSINDKSIKHIGTIAPDLFQDKILIIDYPKKRIGLVDKLSSKYEGASFQDFKIEKGRIKIPFSINDKVEFLLFDTGSSLFTLLTTSNRAKSISNDKIIDSIKTSTWGEYYFVYGQKVTSKIKFGSKELEASTVYFDKSNRFANFYNQEGIWGITGNAYFFNNVIIIDYRNRRFGVK